MSSDEPKTILLVDDEDSIRNLAALVLEAQGYRVIKAQHSDEALILLDSFKDPVHLLLTDVIMPRQSGRALAERLRPLRPELQVLFMSGYTNEAIVRHGVLEPGTLFIQKPFTPEGLGRKVREALDLGHGASRAGS